jgi:hypothetical protein
MNTQSYYGDNYANDNKLNTFLSGTTEFMDSNSMISNVVFLLGVIIIFIILMQLGVQLVYYLVGPSENPKIINGMVEGTSSHTFSQNPNDSGSKPIFRSNNQLSGIEFTWSVWLYISEYDNDRTKYRHVFHKGDGTMLNEDYAVSDISFNAGMNFPSNSPGLYLKPWENELLIVMNTHPDTGSDGDVTRADHILEKIEIDNIPMNNWVNVIITCKNHNLDVYINGTISKRHILTGVPKQNYGDIHVGGANGFNGKLSNLWYWNRNLGTQEINNIVKHGPDKRMISNTNLTSNQHNYLSMRWFLGNYDVSE